MSKIIDVLIAAAKKAEERRNPNLNYNDTVSMLINIESAIYIVGVALLSELEKKAPR